MARSDLTLGALANLLLASTETKRAAIITAPETGNFALAEIDLQLARHLVAVQYEHVGEIDAVVAGGRGSFDLVVVDPFHTYESSVGALERCLDLLQPGGILLCHDCVPPPDYVDPEFRSREWCGVTFAAFRDVMQSRNAAWCTLAADFGIGIAVAPNAASDATATGAPGFALRAEGSWTVEEHDTYVERYLADPFGFMRTVRADEWRTAVERFRTGNHAAVTGERADHLDLADLVAVRAEWDDLLPPGALGISDALAAARSTETTAARRSSSVRRVARALRRAARSVSRGSSPQ